MEFDEKIDYILEQLRATMASNNYIRAELVHKKIQPAKLDEDKEKLAVRLGVFVYWCFNFTRIDQYVKMC